MTLAAPESPDKLGRLAWEESIRLACRWMIDRSQIHTPRFDQTGMSWHRLDRYQDWTGAFRGEYRAATRQWDFFCPVWHGGQGVKALALAYELLGDEEYLAAAREGAGFILRHRIDDADDPDHGLIYAWEGHEGVNTSAQLECLDGLFELARVSGDRSYADAATQTLRWIGRRLFLPDEGLFLDDFDPETRSVRQAQRLRVRPEVVGRPLLEDGVFIKGWRHSGDDTLRTIAVRTADRLVAEEDPPGNWKWFKPAIAARGLIHPRHGYWWGRPMWMVHRATGDAKYLDCCRRSAEWYRRAMRIDGGMFRATDEQFNTSSFGQATSGIAGAVQHWAELAREYGDAQWDEPILRALSFCRGVQFRRADDENLRGAILEKILPPNGSDAAPWYLRDVGTFFYVQAACVVLRDLPGLVCA